MVTFEKNTHLTQFGFRFNRGGTHLSRTMMFEDLRTLLEVVDAPDATRKDYLQAIKEDNCLGKRSGKTRELTSRHLVDLYSLDKTDILFRALLLLWHRDPAGRPLLALLCACARGPSLFRTESAGLPGQYPVARFLMWLQGEGIHDQIKNIETQRQLLAEPDLIPPLVNSLTQLLRDELNIVKSAWDREWQAGETRLKQDQNWQQLEPELQEVFLPGRTLKTKEDVGAWLDQARELLMEKISKGPVLV